MTGNMSPVIYGSNYRKTRSESTSSMEMDSEVVDCGIEEERVTKNGGATTFCKRSYFCPVLVALVGLPARGKTFIANKLSRYLQWTGYASKVFSVSEYRRAALENYDGHEYFSKNNSEGLAVRQRCCLKALGDICDYLDHEGEVAVLDATNSTKKRRQLIHDIIVQKMGFKLLFVEAVCDEPQILDIYLKSVCSNSPDYIEMTKDKAMNDILKKVQHFSEVYETIDSKEESNYSFIKIQNAGQSYTIHKPSGHMESKIISFLTALTPLPKTIYFTRHGESENNIKGRIGGDANLTFHGKQYAKRLAHYFNTKRIPDLKVWTSQFKRTHQTAAELHVSQERVAALNEINAGVCEGLTYEEIQDRFPEEFACRDQNKFQYRYPKGESYEDVVARLEPVILELEQKENVLVISHQAVLRCALGYFLNEGPEAVPYIKVPLHTIVKLTSDALGSKVEYVTIPVDCVTTHREKPTDCTASRSLQEALRTVPAHF